MKTRKIYINDNDLWALMHLGENCSFPIRVNTTPAGNNREYEIEIVLPENNNEILAVKVEREIYYPNSCCKAHD